MVGYILHVYKANSENGRHLNEEILHLVKTDRNFPKQKKKQYYIS
jgi:hypothetical protein